MWEAGEAVASGIARRGDMFRSDAGVFVHEGQSAPEPRTTHDAALGTFPDTPPEVFEAKLTARVDKGSRQSKSRHLESSLTLTHDEGSGGGQYADSPRKALAARRSKANPKWQGGTPPHRSSGDASEGHAAGAASKTLAKDPLSVDKPLGSGHRRALGNTSQFTIGAVTGGGMLDIYTPGTVQPVATKKAVASQPALLAAGPRWASTLRDDAHGGGGGADAFDLSRSAARGR